MFAYEESSLEICDDDIEKIKKLTSARKYDVFSELFSVGIAGGADSLCCFSVTI